MSWRPWDTWPTHPGENRWGWMAWSEDFTGWQERHNSLYYQPGIFYRHQVSWLRYPYYSFQDILSSGSIPNDGMTQTLGGIYELVLP